MYLLDNPDKITNRFISLDALPEVPGGEATQFEIQAALIPDRHKFEYQSARKLARRVESIVDSGTANEYFLYFHGVTDREFNVIYRELRRFQLRSTVRLTFENALDAAILRIIPGSEHARIGMNLYLAIAHKITHDDESFESFGATLLQVPGVRSKQGDQGVGIGTRLGRNAWHLVMVEVGYSGGEDFLHLDAHWWLTNSPGRVRFVILVCITMNSLALRIECWRMVEQGRRETRQAPSRVATCIQDFNIDQAGVVKSTLGSTELRIPYDCVFDQHHDEATDVVFSFEELGHFAPRRFRQMEE